MLLQLGQGPETQPCGILIRGLQTCTFATSDVVTTKENDIADFGDEIAELQTAPIQWGFWPFH